MAINKPYPKYKNSNIPWLGEIPEHWEIEKVKRQFEVSRGRVIANTDLIDNGNYPVYSSQTKHKGLLGKIDTYDYDGEYISWTTDGVYAGTTFVRKGKFNATNICGLLKPKNNVNIDYFGYLFSHIIPPNKRPDTNGAKIMSNEMKNISFIIPPFEEQTAIARFLDYKLAKINRFIQKKKQLIKLFNEQKAAIINQAVTKGLDPNAKMKDSGIEWLGEIPEHWEVKPIKHFVTCNDESLTDKTDKDYQLRYIDIGNVDSNGNVSEIVSYKFKDAPSRARRIVKEGDIIVSTVRTYLKAIMHINVDTENLIVSTGFAVLRPRKNVLSEFLNYAIRANYFIGKVVSESNGVSYPAINSTKLITLKIAIPMIGEQKKIVQFIDSETATINTTISKIEKELALTEEYKTALIAEAVTGKIDVRGYEVPEISEEESYEEIEDPDSYRDSMAAEDEEEYQTTEE